MRIKKKIWIALFLLLINTRLFGQWSNDPTVNTPVITESKKQISQEILPDGNGGMYLTYLSGSDDREKIYVTRLDSVLNKLWAAGSVGVATTLNQQFKPAFLSAGQKGVVLFWEETNNIYGQRLEPGGTKQWGIDGMGVARRLSPLQKQSNPAATKSGDFYIAFRETQKIIRLQRMDVSGNRSAWGESGVTVLSDAGTVQHGPFIAPDGSNGVYVGWIMYGQLYCQRVDQAGNLVWNPSGVRIATDSYIKEDPQMLADGNGNVVFVWDTEIDSLHRVKAQKLDSGGNRLWWSQGLFVCEARSRQSDPDAAADNQGGIVVVWQDEESIGINIYCQRLAANGDKLWDAAGVAISGSMQNSNKPVIVRDRSNKFIVAWEENENIHAQKMTSDGATVWQQDGLVVTSASNEQSKPVIIDDDNGNTVFIWQDLRNGTDYDLYAQRVDRLGFLGIDETPPTLSHVPIAEIDEQTSLKIEVQVEDPQAGVKDVRLHFKNDEQPDFEEVEVSSDSANVYTFEIPAEDIVLQNVHYYFEASDNYENSTRYPESGEFIVRVLDRTPPVVQHENIDFANENQSLKISFAPAEEDWDIMTGMLFYKPGGGSIVDSVEMVYSESDSFSGTIPAEDITLRGIQYYFVVIDSSDNETRIPEEGWFSVRTHSEGMISSQTQPAEQYMMFSVPLELNDSSPDCVLVDDLGNYNIKAWRLFQWAGGDDKYLEFGEKGFRNFTPGASKWLISKQKSTIDVGAGNSVNFSNDFRIDLNTGWNMIADPFVFPVKWNQVTKNECYDTLFSFDGTEWNFADEIEPWNGYFVYATGENAFLEIPPVEATESLEKYNSQTLISKIGNSGGWMIQLTASCRDMRDRINYIGVSPDASNNRDIFDLIEPPNPPGDYISLCFPHAEWSSPPRTVTTDFRPPDQDGYSWEFRVLTNIRNSEVHVEFETLIPAPEKYRFLIIDQATNSTHSVSDDAGYIFLSGSNQTVRKFTLHAGNEHYYENRSVNSPVPENFELRQNYPNPFNSATEIRYALPQKSRVTIRILNVLGKEIKSLLRDQWKEAGYHAVIWDGTNEWHHQVASGIYFYQLMVDGGGYNSIRKMIYVK